MSISQSRRSFMKLALSGAAGAAFGARGMSADSIAGHSAIMPEQYFDLPHRARLALHPLTNLLDAGQGYLPYFDANYAAKPPVAIHIRWDYGDCLGRYTDAIRLARIMSGSKENDPI